MQGADRLVLLVVGLLSSVWCLTAARQLGPTFDEPFYLEAGLDFWRTGNPRALLAAGTMPLAPHLQTLPLYVIERVTGRPWLWSEDVATMLVVARSVTLLFWWVLLFYAWRWGRDLGGAWAGRLSVVLLGLEPNFLAHAGLATTDLCLAAFLMVFLFHFRAGRDRRWGWRVGVPTVLFAVALLAKASTVVFGPIGMLIIELEHLARNGSLGRAWNGRWPDRAMALWRQSRPFLRDGAMVCGAGLLLAVAYCGSGGGPSFQGTLARMSEDHLLRPVVAWVGGLPLFPNGFYALWFQIDHSRVGQPVYLLGYESARALWFYVPVLLTIKLPLVLLGLFALSLCAPRPRISTLLAACGFLILMMVLVQVQTGIRFLLPILGFVVVWIAVRTVALPRALSKRPQAVGVGVLVAMLGWLVAGNLRAWPDALRYTNELWGGTDRGYLVVSDSNYDWGQGLPDLARWQRQHGTPLAVWYFGTDPRYPELLRYDPRRDGLDAPALKGRSLAVSTSIVYGAYMTGGPGRELMTRLRQQQPSARTRTFLIFDEAQP